MSLPQLGCPCGHCTREWCEIRCVPAPALRGDLGATCSHPAPCASAPTCSVRYCSRLRQHVCGVCGRGFCGACFTAAEHVGPCCRVAATPLGSHSAPPASCRAPGIVQVVCCAGADHPGEHVYVADDAPAVPLPAHVSVSAGAVRCDLCGSWSRLAAEATDLRGWLLRFVARHQGCSSEAPSRIQALEAALDVALDLLADAGVTRPELADLRTILGAP